MDASLVGGTESNSPSVTHDGVLADYTNPRCCRDFSLLSSS